MGFLEASEAMSGGHLVLVAHRAHGFAVYGMP